REDLNPEEGSVHHCLYQFTRNEKLTETNKLLCDVCTQRHCGPKNNIKTPDSAKPLPSQNVPEGNRKVLYSLYGVVEHSGTMRSGHYTAYVKMRTTNNHLSDLVLRGQS
ncbi:UBP16 hydrolase, partial [Neodrepanis coruscans]|nr:UBP16 hydrolase [Neodrepanis coruscans]